MRQLIEISTRVVVVVRTREPRRVELIPAPHPQLQRQNGVEEFPGPAVWMLWPRVWEAMDPAQRELIMEAMDHGVQKPAMEYVLNDAETLPVHWECAICLEDNTTGLAWHPMKCHVYHRKCLNSSLDANPKCPMCRNCVTPLLKRNID